MKKVLKVLLVLILIVLVGFCYYLLRVKSFDINKNVYIDEKDKVEDLMNEINRPLTMMILSNCIDNEYSKEEYDLTKNENLLNQIKYKQQFTMEYYLNKTKNYDKFMLVNQEGNEDEDAYVTDEQAIAYLNYDDFNNSYKELFGKDFNMKNREYSPFKTFDDKGYVYYSNRRSGNNGLFIVSDNIDAILKTNNTYKAKVTLNYNERLKEKLDTNEMIIEYSYINDKIVIKSISFK